MVDRFNRRISEVLASDRFDGREDLGTTSNRYCNLYDQYTLQRALNHGTPIQAMKDRQPTHPELFTRQVRNDLEHDSEAKNFTCHLDHLEAGIIGTPLSQVKHSRQCLLNYTAVCTFGIESRMTKVKPDNAALIALIDNSCSMRNIRIKKHDISGIALSIL